MKTEDELDELSNLCTDLVSLRKWEPLLVALFQKADVGQWVPVSQLMLEANTQLMGTVPTGLAVSWIRTPDPHYRILTFFDFDSKWSMHADYNFERLRHSMVPSPRDANPDSFLTNPMQTDSDKELLMRRSWGRNDSEPRGEWPTNQRKNAA